jgi:dienelactone hydrolase
MRVKMLIYNNNSNHALIVLHEIYGVNKHVRTVCESLSIYDIDVICPNLLGKNITFSYSQEKMAYQNFIENIGFQNALNTVKELVLNIKDNYDKIFLIGYSVGATIAWLCSELDFVDGIVGYYGSRIRNYTSISPRCKVKLFFPQEEKSFNVDGLCSTLENKNIELHKFDGLHGFSDPYSPNFHKASAEEAHGEMITFFMGERKYFIK